jgi:hypothetical protein
MPEPQGHLLEVFSSYQGEGPYAGSGRSSSAFGLPPALRLLRHAGVVGARGRLDAGRARRGRIP